MGEVKRGWVGRFTRLTQNTAPIHFDAHYAAQTEWGKPLVDSTFTLAPNAGTGPSLHPARAIRTDSGVARRRPG